MKLDLNNIKWGVFNLNEVFPNIQRGKRLKKDDHKGGTQPYISSTSLNNGVDGFIGNTEKVRIFQSCLTIANSGSVGATFYQPFSFVASDHVTKLENINFNKNIYLFITSIAKRLSEKYSFNREINDKRIQREKIILPINSKGEPDYTFMEQYICQKEQEKIDDFQKYITKRIEKVKFFKETKPLNQKEWEAFFIEDLFEIYTGGDLILQNVIEGAYPVISHSKENNGIAIYSKLINGKKLFDSNKTIGLADRGNFWASIQLMDFYIGTRVKALVFKGETNRYILKFIALSINKQDVRFSYGNNATGKTGKIRILLPIAKKDKPDYEYMENYIKKLEYEKLTKYKEIKTTNRQHAV